MLQDNHITTFETSGFARKRSLWLWALILILLVFQIVISVVLWQAWNGKEFASDMHTYVDYVRDPSMLFRPLEKESPVGGSYAPPALPFMLYVPHRLYSAVFDDFLSYRFTMISWVMLGFGLAMHVALKDFGIPENKKQAIAAVLLALMPVLWMAATVLGQDDSVAAGWSGICLWAWRRWGPWGCTATALLAFWTAKLFFILYLLGLWIGYPKLRLKLVLIGIVFFAAAATAILYRDGNFEQVSKETPPFMGGTLYALYYILFLDSSRETAHAYSHLARKVSIFPTIIALGGWALAGIKRTISLPTAIVGTYSLFFVSFCGMMPEFEYWYLAWVVLVLWATIKNGDWLTFFAGWTHSLWGYLYKVAYSSDRVIFSKSKSVLQNYFEQHFSFDLRWILIFSATATVLSGLVFAILLYRRDPTASAYRMTD